MVIHTNSILSKTTFSLILAIGGAVGCNQHQTPAQPPVTQTSPPATIALAPSAAPAATVAAPAQALPPAPVPATFDVAQLAERVKPMVVNITTSQEITSARSVDPFEFFFGGPGRGGPEGPRRAVSAGTGFIIDGAGLVVTNEHVVREADEVRVRLADDREFAAAVVGRDPRLDLALLRIQGAKDLPSASLGSSEQLRVGEHVLAVGNPFGLGHTVTLGIVSAKARTIGAGPYDDFIQTDASINPGNSGGPLFNWRGEVIGINTAIRPGANGIGFAIPVDALRDILPQLRDKGFVERGKLGLAFQPVTAELARALAMDAPRGALVSDVAPSSAAARAGIRSGDVIVAVNGTPIQHAEELPRNVARNPPGSSVKIGLLRNKQKMEVSARLDALEDEDGASGRVGRQQPRNSPKPQTQDKLGIAVSDAPGGGVRVDDISGSVRELVPGDVVVEVNGAPVRDTQELRSAVARVKPGTTALLKIRRNKSTRFAAAPIPK
jgi:serine protease Do